MFDFWLTTKHSKAILHACCIERQNNRYFFKLKGDEHRNVNSSVARGSLTVLAIVRVKANKQADMDVSPAMGLMLTEMQGCLKQLCGNSAAGNPEAVAQLIAEEMAAMNSSPGHNRVQDKCDDVLTLPAPAEMAAPRMHVDLSTRTQSCTTGLIQGHQHFMTPVGTSAQSNLHGQNGGVDPIQLQRGSSRSRLTPLWCWADVTPACTRRTGTCLSSLSL